MSRYFNYTEDDYVAHFGIKGMKWGVRRYQNNDGSLTPTGKTRYDKKSDHQLKLEAKYQQKGKSKTEAEAAAKKRVKIEKTIAIGAGIAAGSVAAYALIKKYKGHSDNIIAEAKDVPLSKIADVATDKFQQKVKPESFKPATFKPESFEPESFQPKKFHNASNDIDDLTRANRKGRTTYSSATGANWTDLLREAEIKNPGLIKDIENILEWD